MTGEMAWIKQDGTDSNGEQWDIHAAVAKAIRGSELRPFDVYQGPYIRTKYGCLWICSDDGNSGYVFLDRGKGLKSKEFPLHMDSLTRHIAIHETRLLMRRAKAKLSRAIAG